MSDAPTIFLAAWGDSLAYGYSNAAWTLERDPGWTGPGGWPTFGDGHLWASTPTADELEQLRTAPAAGRKAFKQRLFRYHEGTGGLAPGRLVAFRYAYTSGEPTFPEIVADGDTLGTAADSPIRPWVARALVWAGWNVVCDRIPLTR